MYFYTFESFKHCFHLVSKSLKYTAITLFESAFNFVCSTLWKRSKICYFPQLNNHKNDLNFVFRSLWKRSIIPHLYCISVLTFDCFQSAVFQRVTSAQSAFRVLYEGRIFLTGYFQIKFKVFYLYWQYCTCL